MDFYYPNFQNDMWRIFGWVFFSEKDYFLTENRKSFDKERIIRFLSEKGIAVCDTAVEVHRIKGNASDNFLEIITPIDLKKILSEIPRCNAIVTTGQKASETVRSFFPETTLTPRIGSFTEVDFHDKTYKFYRMPSSSRAYPKPLAEKAEMYKQFFNELGFL